MKTVKAARIHNYDGAKAVRVEDTTVPKPQSGELLVRVHAAGVHVRDDEGPSPAQRSMREVFGIQGGYAGLIAGDFVPLDQGTSGSIIQHGDTRLLPRAPRAAGVRSACDHAGPYTASWDARCFRPAAGDALDSDLKGRNRQPSWSMGQGLRKFVRGITTNS